MDDVGPTRPGRRRRQVFEDDEDDHDQRERERDALGQKVAAEARILQQEAAEAAADAPSKKQRGGDDTSGLAPKAKQMNLRAVDGLEFSVTVPQADFFTVYCTNLKPLSSCAITVTENGFHVEGMGKDGTCGVKASLNLDPEYVYLKPGTTSVELAISIEDLLKSMKLLSGGPIIDIYRREGDSSVKIELYAEPGTRGQQILTVPTIDTDSVASAQFAFPDMDERSTVKMSHQEISTMVTTYLTLGWDVFHVDLYTRNGMAVLRLSSRGVNSMGHARHICSDSKVYAGQDIEKWIGKATRTLHAEYSTRSLGELIKSMTTGLPPAKDVINLTVLENTALTLCCERTEGSIALAVRYFVSPREPDADGF